MGQKLYLQVMIRDLKVLYVSFRGIYLLKWNDMFTAMFYSSPEWT